MTFEEFQTLDQDQLTKVSFYISKKLNEKPFPHEYAQAVDLFTKLPTPLTAKYLTKTWPECIILFPMGIDERVDKAEFDKWKFWVDRNLRLTNDIQGFLLKHAINNKVKVGFHRLQDQGELIERLRVVGKTKWFFEDDRQFLRNSTTKHLDLYRVMSNLICIHGIHDGSEVFYNGLGRKVDGQWYLDSGIMFNIFEVTSDFIELVKEIN